MNTRLTLYFCEQCSGFILAKQILMLLKCLMIFTRFFVLCYNAICILSPTILVWFVFDTDVNDRAHSLHVHVPVARIGKPSKQLGFLNFHTFQVVYNSQLLVFYSAQRPATVYGYATNWSRTSWEEIYPPTE